jgi:hypothetical protein
MGKMRNAAITLLDKPEGKGALGRPWQKLIDSSK